MNIYSKLRMGGVTRIVISTWHAQGQRDLCLYTTALLQEIFI
jgi:hypothetical protein